MDAAAHRVDPRDTKAELLPHLYGLPATNHAVAGIEQEFGIERDIEFDDSSWADTKNGINRHLALSQNNPRSQRETEQTSDISAG